MRASSAATRASYSDFSASSSARSAAVSSAADPAAGYVAHASAATANNAKDPFMGASSQSQLQQAAISGRKPSTGCYWRGGARERNARGTARSTSEAIRDDDQEGEDRRAGARTSCPGRPPSRRSSRTTGRRRRAANADRNAAGCRMTGRMMSAAACARNRARPSAMQGSSLGVRETKWCFLESSHALSSADSCRTASEWRDRRSRGSRVL